MAAPTLRDCLDNPQDPIYAWRRFWYKESNLSRSEAGFLEIYQLEDKIITAPDIVSFEQISQTPCLILLGESGMGKSHALCSEYVMLASHQESLLVKLGFSGSEATLYKDLFNSEKFLAWLEGSHHLHLFLDGLDECQSRIPTVKQRLLLELGNHKDKLNRLSLRIACRSGAWSSELEEGLKNLWGNDNFGVYELAQLTSEDVRQAVSENGLNPDDFLKEVYQKEVVPLAARPVTLKMLLAEFRERNGKLPSNQAELYLKACLRLCRERTDPWTQIRHLDEYQCVAIAARIAAVGLFSGRPILWKSLDLDSIPDRDAVITIDDVVGGKEFYDRNNFTNEVEINKDAIRETLSTGLFSRFSADAVIWTHLSYAEYLAASYLEQQKLPLAQVKSLFFHSDGKLVPQLHGAASWAVGMIPELLQEVINAEPEMLFRGNVSAGSDSDRAKLVDSILSLCEQEKIVRRDLPISEYGERLSHPNISAQLKPYISDTNKGKDPRLLAIELARVCRVTDLQDLIVAVATNSSQPLQVRIQSAKTICQIGDDVTKVKLRPLITERIDNDSDQLKGWALKAMWVGQLSVQELFELIEHPKRINAHGIYELFLTRDIAPSLQPEDLPIALQWVEKQQIWSEGQLEIAKQGGQGRGLPPSFRELMNAVILKAVEHLNHPEVIEPLARAVLRSVREYCRISRDGVNELFKFKVWEDSEKRRSVVAAMVNAFLDHTFIASESFYNKLVHITPLVPKEDFAWLMSNVESAETSEQQIWLELLVRRFNPTDRGNVESLLNLIEAEKIPALITSFSSHINPIELDSTAAKLARKYYLEFKRNQIYDANFSGVGDPDPLSESDREFLRQFSDYQEDDAIERNVEKRVNLSAQDLQQRVDQCLNEFKAGDLNAWWILNYWMAVQLDTNTLHEYEPDLSSLPLWQDLEFATREKIIESAKRYIQEQQPDFDAWAIDNQKNRAGYRAFYLLLKLQPDSLSGISQTTWQLWSPIILEYSDKFVSNNKSSRCELVKLAYKNAPSEVIQAFLRLLVKQDEELGDAVIVDDLENCWDVKLLEALLTKLQKTNLKPETMRTLLKTLIQQKYEAVRDFAEKLLKSSPTSDRARIAGSMLISYAEDAGWSILWSILQSNPDFGRSIIEDAVNFGQVSPNVGRVLSESQLADFLIWLGQQYPFSEDPRHESVFSPETRDYIAYLKRAVLSHLQDRGTSQAVAEIQRIKESFPELAILNSILLTAQAKTRSKTWIRPFPREILALVSDRQTRLIRGGDELLSVVYESLVRLENKLQNNENFPVFGLWNKLTPSILKRMLLSLIKPFYTLFPGLEDYVKDQLDKLFNEGFYVPVEEDDFSSYIQQHLNSDIKPLGLVVSREVEINRGDYVDLRIDCITTDTLNEVPVRFSVIVEVKGIWNKDLNTSMKSQLFDRYLSEISCQHGIYLIGWFKCDKWSKNDYRKSSAQTQTKSFSKLEAAKAHFTTEASKLSVPDKQVKAFVLNTSLP